MSRSSVVVTADDFGLAPEINEAVETAHRDGILSAASLMVAEPWAAEAVARAKRLPRLAVGLHLTLVEGTPALPPATVPDLVGRNGRLRADLARYGAEIWFRPRVRSQVAAEIEAQFEAYSRTGLPLHHVDAHKHFHLHPTVAGLILAIGPRFGMRSLRIPVEPAEILRRIEPAGSGWEARLAAPWARLLRRRARGAGLAVADQVFGLAWSGALTTSRLAGLLRNLPPGRTEIYAHPAVSGGFPGAAPGYDYEGEFLALRSPEAKRALAASGAILPAD